MSSESNQLIEEEPKEYTKWIWLGVVVFIVLLIGVMWLSGRQKFTNSAVRAKHILIAFDKNDPVDRNRALEDITRLRDRLLAGESFSKLAKEWSNDPSSAARGGDLGYQPRGIYEEGFEEYVWSAKINELSDIIQSTYGFHLIVVTDRFIAETDQYEEKLLEKAMEKLNTEPETP